MEPPPVNKKAINRRSSIESSQSKKKSSRACAPCRKRKVKCNGQQPCDRCEKTESICVYDKPQQKKDTPKPISDNHEPRLRALDQFLKQFSKLLDRKDPEPPLFSKPNTPQHHGQSQQQQQQQQQHQQHQQHQQQHRLSITTTGQGLYVPDKYLRTDRVPDFYKPSMNDWNPIIQELFPNNTTPTAPLITQSPPMEPIRENLLNIYFQFVDPVIPILHKASFLQQLRNRQDISHLLLNAIYCVSSRWDLAVRSIGEEPRGWAYYQNAVNLLDKQHEPKLSTVQALFLLLKYNEHVRRTGFIWRTRYYFQMIVRMCKDLGLPRDIICTTTNMIVEVEKRKRTFWAVYCYDVMMSIENGTPSNFSSIGSSLDIPHVLADEAQEHEKIMHFILLTKIIRNQADIVDYLRYRRRKNSREIEEEEEEEEERGTKSFEQLTNELKTTIGLITSTTKFPQKETMCYTVCFLYLASCFATILLHRPFALFHQPQSPITMPHQSHCTEAALNVKVITELILECNAFEDMYCSIRGIQQIVHYLSAAVTVFKEGQFDQELKMTMQLTQRLASISPATEVIGGNNRNMLNNNTANMPQQQQEQPLILQQQQQQPPPPQSSNSAPITLLATNNDNNITTAKQRHKQRVEIALKKRKSLRFQDANKSQQDIVEELTLQSPTAKFNRPTFSTNNMIYSAAFDFQQQQQQQQQNINTNNYIYNNNNNNNTSNNTSNMSIDEVAVDLPDIPNHESLLGLLLYNEDESSSSGNSNTRNIST